ncbi:serine hydrolase domain-containing protein [Actinophytocola sp.]|uniref:serine hydrolase domain-containing protein n=1 Tax=Actinophytocola sp. TaxID=1872138 RepID=UPI00389B2EAF
MATRTTRLVAGSVALAVGTACLTAVPAAAQPRHDHADVQSIVDGYVAAGVPGAMVYSRDRRTQWTVSSGTAEIGVDDPIRPWDRVRVASNTKMFVATVVLQLVGEARVALDAPVERYLPGLVRGNGYDGNRITVRQLLRHTSGMADYVADVLADPIANDHPWRPEELVAIGLSHPPLFAPGAGWAYSNTGYIVLGMLVEAATGEDVGTQITDRLIRPLGLHETSYPKTGDRSIRGPHPHGYYAFPGQPVTDFTQLEPSLPGAAGSLISTGPDLTRFLGALLSGRLLRGDLLAEMRTVVPAEGGSYGLGIREIPLPCGGSAWGHGGNIIGFDTASAATRDGRAVFVVANGHQADGAPVDMRGAVETALCEDE